MAIKLVDRNGIYYLRGTVRGQSVYETTGINLQNRQAAEELRAKRESQLIDDSIHGRAATVTFAEAAKSYLESDGSPRFLGEFNERTKKWSGLIGHFLDRKLNTITQSDLDAAGIKLYPGTQADTRNRQCHTPFIAVWNHAYHNKWCEKRDWLRPRKPKGTKAKLLKKSFRAGTTAVTYDKASEFVLAMSPAPAMLMTTLFYTGVRPIELFTLEAHEVNIQNRWIALDTSKTDTARGIPIHEVLVPLFTGLYKRKGFIFRTPRGKPYEMKEDGGGQMKTAINGARRRSGIKDIAPYTGRHTVQTQLVLAGVHPYITKQIIGHAGGDDEISLGYTHIPQPALIDAINKLPVIRAWADAPWMRDPVAWERKLAEGTGKRNDLIRDAA